VPEFDAAVVERIKAMDAEEVENRLEQGDLIERLVPTKANGRPAKTATGVAVSEEATLEALAEQTGIPATTLRRRRQVSVAIPPEMRMPGVAWSAWLALTSVAEDDRTDLVARMAAEEPGTKSGRWTLAAVLTLAGKTQKNQALYRVNPNAPLDDRVAAYKRLQGDKEVMDAIAREVLGVKKQTPEERLREQLKGVREERDDFKARFLALEKSLKDVQEEFGRLKAEQPQGGQTGVEAKPGATEAATAMAGSEARVKEKLAKDKAAQYTRLVGPLENFANNQEASEVALALLTENVPVSADTRAATASKVASWLNDVASALRQMPRLRLLSKIGGEAQ